MDLVKISVAGGIVAAAVLALAATARPGVAQSSIAQLPATVEADDIQARIDSAFSGTARQPVFDASGPLFPPATEAVPVLPVTLDRPNWPPVARAKSVWSSYVDEAAARFGLPAAWLHGVMQVESGGRTHIGGQPITSSAGAMGLMQVMPATFAEMRARYGLGADPYDPRTNILAGAAYLREMYDRYGERHFLAAYNAGPGRVDAWLRGRASLPAETRAYASTLLPRLGFTTPAAHAAPAAVQDLTSAAAMSSLLAPASRRTSEATTEVVSSLVLAGRSAGAATAIQRAERPPTNGLFVILTAVDRRREVSAQSSDQD